jgi:HEAT repeat protein
MTEPTAPEAPVNEDPPQSFASEMSRFFVVPAAIVVLCVGVFLLFGLIASEGKSAADYLQEIRQGASNRRWQAAYELSRVLSRDAGKNRASGVGVEIAAILQDPKTTEPLVRRYLVVALEAVADPQTAPALVAALSDQDVEVRLYAARALARLPGDASVKALLPLLQDQDAALRKMALYSLGRIGDPSAAEAIRPRLEDTVEDVRWNAALSLAVLGDASGAGVLREMLDIAHLDRIEGITEEQKLEARVNALQAIYKLRDPSLRGLVEEISAKDPSLHVRDIALKVLKEWT